MNETLALKQFFCPLPSPALAQRLVSCVEVESRPQPPRVPGSAAWRVCPGPLPSCGLGCLPVPSHDGYTGPQQPALLAQNLSLGRLGLGPGVLNAGQGAPPHGHIPSGPRSCPPPSALLPENVG